MRAARVSCLPSQCEHPQPCTTHSLLYCCKLEWYESCVTRIQHLVGCVLGTPSSPHSSALPFTRARGAALARVQLTPNHLSVRCSVLLYLVSATSSRLSRAGKSKCRASSRACIFFAVSFSALCHSGTTSLHGWMVGSNTTTITTTTVDRRVC
jgi:hypothetical protein